MYNVVGFLSRPHGLTVLRSILASSNYNLLSVYTHKLNPKSQDSSRSVRHDYHLFEEICKSKNIPVISIDSKNYNFEEFPQCDIIVEVSWRYLIPDEITKKAKIISFGIHRGKLPEYAGAEPIKQALLKNEKEIILSAHNLNANIDAGEVLATISHKVNYNSQLSLDDNIQKIRDEITPKFSDLLFITFSKYS
jgi:methionyl-tRNA formyltransferase